MKISTDTKLDYSDVLIVPKTNDLVSRNDVSLERTIQFKHSNNSWTGVPIMVANMDTTGTIEMALEMQKNKIITCLHKFYNINELEYAITELNLDPEYFAISCGTGEHDLTKLKEITQIISPKFICLDVANGYLNRVIEVIEKIRELYPNITLIAGNVVTHDVVLKYYNAGVDIVKMGIGSGSVCTTRLQTGIGYPQLSCILDTRPNIPDDCYIISDGGIQLPGDFSKAYGAGADFVMSGGMFAGHEECSGDIIEENGTKYKVFYGMSSENAMKKHYGTVSKYRSSEGKCVKIKYRGRVADTLQNILGGIRSTMTYIGAHSMEEVYSKTEFIKVNNQANRIYTGKEV